MSVSCTDLLELTCLGLLCPYSSSESDMEEEDEPEDQEEVEQHLPSPSDLGGVPWKDAVELHAKLRCDHSDDEALADGYSRDGEVDEEDEEEDDEEDEESSDGTFYVLFCEYSAVGLHVLCSDINSSVSCVMSPSSNILVLIICCLLPHRVLLITFLPLSSICVHLCMCIFVLLGLCLPLLAEGDYCPWNRELQSGLWLEKFLTDEEDVGTFKGSSSRTACGCVCSDFERDILSWLVWVAFPKTNIQ